MRSPLRPLRLLGGLTLVAALSLFAGLRTQGAEEEINDRARKSIEKGYDWLLKAQNKDGSWGLDSKTPGDVTCTALAGLVLLADGHTEREGGDPRYVKAVQGAAEYILSQARKARSDISFGSSTTLIQGKLGTTVHNHFAVVFLSQVYGMRTSTQSEDANAGIRDIIKRMTDFIAKQQDPDGSWHKETFGSLKATCMAWLALRASGGTGVPIEGATLDKTLKFIRKCHNKQTRLYHLPGNQYGGGYGDYQTLYATSSAVRVLQGCGLGSEKECLDAIDAFHHNVTKGQWQGIFLSVEGEDYLAAMMMTHALVSENGERWKRWFPFVRDSLAKRQNNDGSWTTTACISGKTFATACALLTLQTPNRLLPIQE